MVKRKPIFYDEERRRWRRTRRVLEISGILFTLLIVTFFVNILRRPNLPELLLPSRSPLYRPVTYSRTHRAPVKPKRISLGPARLRKVAAIGDIPETYEIGRASCR